MILWRFFSSVKLTLTLLLGMALVAIPGTIIKPDMGRFELFYQTPWFRALLVLLAMNLLVCTLRTFSRNLRDPQRFMEQLAGRSSSARLLTDDSLDVLEQKLRKIGFRGDRTGNRLWARRGRIGRWGSTLVHCSLLAIMFGAVLGGTGFVGTINTYLYEEQQTYFDWDSESEKPLGFSLRVDRFALEYYPITLRFDLVDPAEGQKIGTFTLQEGEDFTLAGGLWRIEAKSFNPDEKLLTLGINRQGRFLGDYLVFADDERFGVRKNPGFQVENVQFRDPILKQMESDVVIIERGKIVKKGTIRANEPLFWRGVKIFQTAYGRDRLGNWTTGFQLSKDPGEPIFWGAAILLCLGLCAAFIVPYRAVGIRRDREGFTLQPLHGFRGEDGQELLVKIMRRLEEKT